MDVRWLEESSILSITLDQQQRYFETVVSLHNEAKQKLMAWNANGSELTIKLGALHLRPTSEFLELEAISIVGKVLSLEGDFSDIAITATAISVEKVVRQPITDDRCRFPPWPRVRCFAGALSAYDGERYIQ